MQFRCLNPECVARLEPLCQPFEFAAGEQSPCPECGSANVVRLEVIHFDPPRGKFPAKGTAACNGSIRYTSGTAVPAVVNCPACRETQAWQEADAATRRGA